MSTNPYLAVYGSLTDQVSPQLDELTQGIGFPQRPVRAQDTGLVLSAGGLRKPVAATAGANITTTPTLYTGFSELAFGTIGNVAPNIGSSGILIPTPGLYQAIISLNLTFTEVNNSRQLDLRLRNITDNITFPATSVGIARNQDAVAISQSFNVDLAPANKLWGIAFSASQTIANVVVEYAYFSVQRLN